MGVAHREDMNESAEQYRRKYEALRRIAVKTAKDGDFTSACQAALDDSLEILDIEAGAITLMNAEGETTSHFDSGSEDFVPLMNDMEEKLILMLRSDFEVDSLFLTFNRNGKHSLFSYPLAVGDQNLGTISGITTGERNLSVEEDFIEAVSSQLALALRDSGVKVTGSGEELKKARTEAIIETAVTINHEINNPLTAVLGNVQLLLVDREKIDPAVLRKLEAIESAALRIKDVTGRLMKTVEPSVTEYVNGIKMVDINKTSPKDRTSDKSEESE